MVPSVSALRTHFAAAALAATLGCQPRKVERPAQQPPTASIATPTASASAAARALPPDLCRAPPEADSDHRAFARKWIALERAWIRTNDRYDEFAWRTDAFNHVRVLQELVERAVPIDPRFAHEIAEEAEAAFVPDPNDSVDAAGLLSLAFLQVNDRGKARHWLDVQLEADKKGGGALWRQLREVQLILDGEAVEATEWLLAQLGSGDASTALVPDADWTQAAVILSQWGAFHGVKALYPEGVPNLDDQLDIARSWQSDAARRRDKEVFAAVHLVVERILAIARSHRLITMPGIVADFATLGDCAGARAVLEDLMAVSRRAEPSMTCAALGYWPDRLDPFYAGPLVERCALQATEKDATPGDCYGVAWSLSKIDPSAARAVLRGCDPARADRFKSARHARVWLGDLGVALTVLEEEKRATYLKTAAGAALLSTTPIDPALVARLDAALAKLEPK